METLENAMLQWLKDAEVIRANQVTHVEKLALRRLCHAKKAQEIDKRKPTAHWVLKTGFIA